MDTLEMAKALFGGQQKSGSTSGGQTTTAYGTAVSDSADGIVMVDLGGETTSLDDEQAVEVETTFSVKEGDEVIVSLVGADGTGKRPVIIGVVGRGDEMQSQINAVQNYFWTDQYGAHVSTEEHSVNGANVLLDSDSLDIRNGNSNSESDQTVYASFGREVTVGSRASGSTVGNYSQVFGRNCVASGIYSHADGFETQSTGMYSHAEGHSTVASGNYSHAEGASTISSGIWSHSEGTNTEASGDYSHAEGHFCTATAIQSHAEGSSSHATGHAAHAEGSSTASGSYSHAEGYRCTASQSNTHAEGFQTTASGAYSHAEGANSVVGGIYSHVEGDETIASGEAQHVQGRYNVEDTNNTYLDIIGNGTVGSSRRNAYNLDWSGNAEFQGEVYVGGCTPNGETPYPVVRYNTSASQSEYWSGSAWTAVPGGGGGGHNYQTRSVSYSATIGAGAVSGTNLKTLIDNDLPTGWSFFTICGTATNSGNGLVQSFAYLNSNASLRVRNLGTASATINTTIYYIAVED